GLHRDDGVGDLDVRRLAADRVGLAQQLLHEELELAAYLAAGPDHRAQAIDVRAQPLELLADVDAVGEDAELPHDVLRRELRRAPDEELVDALDQPRSMVVDDERR